MTRSVNRLSWRTNAPVFDVSAPNWATSLAAAAVGGLARASVSVLVSVLMAGLQVVGQMRVPVCSPIDSRRGPFDAIGWPGNVHPASPSTNGYTGPAPARRRDRATTASVHPESL